MNNRKYLVRTVARVLMVTVPMIFTMNGIQIRKAYGINWQHSDTSEEFWQWDLLTSTSEFPKTDTPVMLTQGDYAVPGNTFDMGGSGGDGHYVSMINCEAYVTGEMEPIDDMNHFITRGMFPSFWMGEWDSGRYYFKPYNDKNRYIEHIDKNAFESGCDNWWYELLSICRSDEKKYDSDDVYWMFKVDVFGNNTFGFYAPNTGDDFQFCSDFCGSWRFGVGYRSTSNASTHWHLYKGTKISKVTVLKTTGSTNYTVKSGEVMTVKDLTYLPYNRTLTIEDGAMLIVSGRFVLNGTLINKGTLIVDEGGFIFPLDAEVSDSYIRNQGGDVIVREDGIIAVYRFGMEKGGNLLNYGAVSSVWTSLDAPLVDNRGLLVFGVAPNRSYLRVGSDYLNNMSVYQNSAAYYVFNSFDYGYFPNKVKISGDYRLINNGKMRVRYFKNSSLDNTFEFNIQNATREGKGEYNGYDVFNYARLIG